MDGTDLFLKYAYSCADVQRDYLHKITDSELRRVREMIAGAPFDEPLIRKMFAPALGRLEEIAALHGLEPLSHENVSAYFLIYHNQYIDALDGNYAQLPPKIREFCKVHIVRVTEVDSDGRKRWFSLAPHDEPLPYERALDPFHLAVENDALVAVHQGLAVTAVDEQEYARLLATFTALPPSLRRGA